MKNTMQRQENKVIFPLACLVINIKHRTIFILQNKFFKRHVDLSLLLNTKNFHYVLSEDFDIFMTNQITHHGKTYF